MLTMVERDVETNLKNLSPQRLYLLSSSVKQALPTYIHITGRSLSTPSMKRSSSCRNEPPNHPTPSKSINAFSVLMQAGVRAGADEGISIGSNKKPKKKSPKKQHKSQFVECPAGCGRHVPEFDINNHLDQCMNIIAAKYEDQDVVVLHDDNKIDNKNDHDRKEKKEGQYSDETGEDKKVLFSSSDTNCEKTEESVGVCGSGSGSVSVVGEPKIDNSLQILDDISGESKSSPSESARIPTATTTSTSTTTTNNNKNNIFSHMMKRSATVFASPSQPQHEKLSQRFHLEADGTVTLTCYTTYPGLSQPESIAWSETTQIKLPPTKTTIIELVISSSIPSFQSTTSQTPISSATSKQHQSISSSKIKNHTDTNYGHRNHPYVKRHSRLSIPVLKSILQKSIRRRKPLPSVRIAMELTDKSIDDVLRRLPIIILEDSTLHPNFPLIIWLMVASSKGYIIPPNLIQKSIFQTIYEICSCRYRDPLPREAERVNDDVNNNNNDTGKEGAEKEKEVSLSSYHTNKLDHTATEDETIIWSILLRIQYGGMKCDTRMLRRYADLWNTRFNAPTYPEADISYQNLAMKTTSTNNSNGNNSSSADEQKQQEKQDYHRWSKIPTSIHQQSTSTSSNNFDMLSKNGIKCLTIADITWEGIDFHCSSVVDTMLNDPGFIEKYNERLESSLSSSSSSLSCTTGNDAHNKSYLEGILKSCMWKYSSSINRRLPLIKNHHNNVVVKNNMVDGGGDDDNNIINKEADDKDKVLRAFWKELVLPRAKLFAERYVRDRLC